MCAYHELAEKSPEDPLNFTGHRTAQIVRPEDPPAEVQGVVVTVGYENVSSAEIVHEVEAEVVLDGSAGEGRDLIVLQGSSTPLACDHDGRHRRMITRVGDSIVGVIAEKDAEAQSHRLLAQDLQRGRPAREAELILVDDNVHIVRSMAVTSWYQRVIDLRGMQEVLKVDQKVAREILRRTRNQKKFSTKFSFVSSKNIRITCMKILRYKRCSKKSIHCIMKR